MKKHLLHIIASLSLCLMLGVAAASVAALWYLLQRTPFGRVVRAGVQNPDMVAALGISLRSAERNWTYARTWLHRELSQVEPADADPQGSR